MKLLIVTQIVDSTDSNLGFFHRWIEEFAKHCESVEVICLKEGEHSLPGNVYVHSLGKESGTSSVTKLIRFYRYIFKYRNSYDAVLVHMNPEYVILACFFWKRWGKKVGLWYAHRSNNRKLRSAVQKVDYVFTVAKDSFSVPTPKLRAVGHGIDTDAFKPAIKEESTQLRVCTAGRIAKSKHLLEMFEMLGELYVRKERFAFSIVGEPVTEEEESYAKKLDEVLEMVPWKSDVRFLGSMTHDQMPQMLRTQDVALNFSTTGNMDKAGLEALAAGVPLLATNPAFKELLQPYGLYVYGMDARTTADALLSFFNRPDQSGVLATLRNKVVADHSLSGLIPRILSILKS